MPRYQLQASFHPHSKDHVWFEFPFDKECQSALKALPGFVWEPDAKRWLVPIELQHQAAEIAAKFRYHATPLPQLEVVRPLDTKMMELGLFPHQIEGYAFLRDQAGGFLFFEPGLGKTAPALLAALEIGHTLMVCPAIVRLAVAREAQRWCPGASVEVIEPGRGMELNKDITIVSYNMLPKLETGAWPSIIVDECHNIKNAKSGRSKIVRSMIETRAPEFLAMLSGTPIPNKPEDLWHPLDLMHPSRFGTYWRFTERYALVGHNGYGRTLGGLHPIYGPELAHRMDAVGVRATTESAGVNMPPFHLTPVWLPPERIASKEDAFLRDVKAHKIAAARQLLEEAQSAGSKVAIVTYHRDVAQELAKLAGVPAITGELPIDKRMALIDRLAADPTAPIVATMASIQEGLNNLVAWHDVILAETYYRPASVIQVLRRFHRLTSQSMVTVRVPILQGTYDEEILATLTNKTADINKVIRAGAIETSLEGVVQSVNLEDAFAGWLGNEDDLPLVGDDE